jgi:hypothetical protein
MPYQGGVYIIRLEHTNAPTYKGPFLGSNLTGIRYYLHSTSASTWMPQYDWELASKWYVDNALTASITGYSGYWNRVKKVPYGFQMYPTTSSDYVSIGSTYFDNLYKFFVDGDTILSGSVSSKNYYLQEGNPTSWIPIKNWELASKYYVDSMSSASAAQYWTLVGNGLYPTTIGNHVSIGTTNYDAGCFLSVSGNVCATGNFFIASTTGRVWGITGLNIGHTVTFAYGGDFENSMWTGFGTQTILRSYHGLIVQNYLPGAGVIGPALTVRGTTNKNIIEFQNSSSAQIGYMDSSANFNINGIYLKSGISGITSAINGGSLTQIDSSGGIVTGLTGVAISSITASLSGATLWTRSGTNTYLTNSSDNVGIGISNPQYRLSLGGDLANTKLALWESGGSYGMGVQAGQFILHLNAASDKYSFYDDYNLSNELVVIKGDGNVGIGVVPSGDYKLEVKGAFAADAKSFVIDHPTKKGKLRHGSLEGPEFGIYIRGILNNSNEILLPDYWDYLADDNSIEVQVTPIGKYQNIYVDKIEKNKIILKRKWWIFKINKINCFYIVHASRKDVKLKVEDEQ